MSSAEIVCANPDCNIAVDGKCVEGLERGACPNFGRPPTPKEAASEDAPPTAPTSHSLSPSAVLDVLAASRLLAARTSRVVGIIATFDAGKTSLIAAMYDALQRNPMARISFAGSSTLHSFEVACHDSRSASRREEASIFRTPLGDARFYHLDLSTAEEREVVSLLIADRAGEEYMAVSSDVSRVHPLFEVRRADTITLLVDGARLIVTTERHNVRAEVEGILQGLKDGDALNGRQRLAIALTKNDAVQGSDRAATAMADFDRLVANIRKLYGSSFAEIETFITAASPKVANAARGQGLPELLAYWLKPPFSPIERPVFPQTTREFERLKELDA